LKILWDAGNKYDKINKERDRRLESAEGANNALGKMESLKVDPGLITTFRKGN
jgi:hypothetical protein